MSTRFIMNEPAFQQLTHGLDGMVGRDLNRRGKLVRDLAKKQVGVRSGVLRASIHSDLRVSRRGLVVTVGSSVPYAHLHHEGTAAHNILAKPNRFLQFTYKGRRWRASAVRHPGTKANKYLTDHLEAAVAG